MAELETMISYPNTSDRIGDTYSPLTTQIAKKIRNKIVTGKILGGERLVENRLSEELGVSRIPVREALRLLASEGFVSIEPRKGATVSQLSTTQVREMLEVRATLEGLNAQLAASRRDPEQIAELTKILEMGSKLAKSDDDIADFIIQNNRFHEALGRVANNTLLQEMMRPLRDRTAMLFTVSDSNQIIRSWEEHENILKAVISGDAELASLLAKRHVYNAANSFQVQPHPKTDNQ